MRRRQFLAATLAALAGARARGEAQAAPAPGDLAAGDHLVTQPLPIGSYTGAGPETRLVCAPGLENLFIGTGDLVLRDLTLVGNGTGRSYKSGFAALIRDGTIVLDGVSLENFRASYWVHGERSQLTARNVRASSKPGNLLNGAAINEQSCVLAVHDGTLEVEDSQLDCAYLKGGIALYGGSTGRILRTVISEAGTSEAVADNCGAYAILAYAIESRCPTLTVTDCSIDGARSCGIYAARAVRVEVTGTRFARITDRVDGTLPKAAIALVASPDYLLKGNQFEACYKSIVLTTPTSRRELIPE